mgnify:CR=1 FL=1
MQKLRKIFFVVASGGHGTDKHYYDTIERKRTIEETAEFLKHQEIEILRTDYHDGPFAVWGAVPGSGNMRTWETMESGDYSKADVEKLKTLALGHDPVRQKIALKILAAGGWVSQAAFFEPFLKNPDPEIVQAAQQGRLLCR